MEPLEDNDTPDGSACGRHGPWKPAAISCKHVYSGRAEPVSLRLHRQNRRIACPRCFDDWDSLRYYCPACLLAQLRKFYGEVAKQVVDEEWFLEDTR